MAAQPQQTLATANAPTAHGALLAGTPPSTKDPSPHLTHYTSGRFGCSSALGSGGDGSGGSGREGIGHTRSLLSSPCSTSSHSNHNQTLRPASRRVRPCSLCGTTALRPQPTFLPTTQEGSLEQPIVLLHRLEDGLPQGDVKSLHAYGTIRLLPVQSTQGHEAPDYDGQSDTSDGDDSRVKEAMKPTMKGPTDVDNSTSAISWYEKGGSHDCSDVLRERLEGNDQEHEVTSVFLEESFPLEAIVESEVTVSSHSDLYDKLKDDGGGVQVHSVVNHLNYVSDNDSDCENELTIQIEKVESIKDLNDNSGNFFLTNNDHGPKTQSKVSNYLEINNEVDVGSSESIIVSENYLYTSPSSSSASSLHYCNQDRELSSSTDSQPLNVNHSSTSALKCPSTSLTTQSTSSSVIVSQVSSNSCLASVSTITTTCMQPSVATQLVVSQCSSTVIHPVPNSTKCHPSPSNCDHSIPYSPKLRHSPVPWSPPTVSAHLPVPPSFICHKSLSTVSSPPSSPPSPSESVSLLFSPPPSPILEITQLNYSRAIEKSESHTRSLSPYSPGSSPSSPVSPASPIFPASPVSPSVSPPSPSASGASPLSSPEILHLAPVKRDDPIETTSDTVSPSHHPLEVCDTLTAPQHPVTLSHGSQDDPTINAQVKCSLDINNTSTYTQVELRENNECNNPLRLSDSMAYDDSEMKTKSNLDNSASSIVEHINIDAEADSSPMKIKVRIRPKLSKLPVQKVKKDECNKNGIPKIVLTLKGNGPNKEYSCSNRLRNEDQSFSNVSMAYRKHKSKKDKKQKDKCKVRKSLKGNKYKRHLELFGEDSNDSLELKNGNHNGVNGQGEDTLTVPDELKDDGAESPVAFPTLGESPENSDDDFIIPVTEVQYNYSENIIKVCEKVRRSSPDETDVLDDSFSDSLPDLEPVPDPEDVGGLHSLQVKKEEDSQVQPKEEDSQVQPKEEDSQVQPNEEGSQVQSKVDNSQVQPKEKDSQHLPKDKDSHIHRTRETHVKRSVKLLKINRKRGMLAKRKLLRSKNRPRKGFVIRRHSRKDTEHIVRKGQLDHKKQSTLNPASSKDQVSRDAQKIHTKVGQLQSSKNVPTCEEMSSNEEESEEKNQEKVLSSSSLTPKKELSSSLLTPEEALSSSFLASKEELSSSLLTPEEYLSSSSSLASKEELSSSLIAKKELSSFSLTSNEALPSSSLTSKETLPSSSLTSKEALPSSSLTSKEALPSSLLTTNEEMSSSLTSKEEVSLSSVTSMEDSSSSSVASNEDFSSSSLTSKEDFSSSLSVLPVPSKDVLSSSSLAPKEELTLSSLASKEVSPSLSLASKEVSPSLSLSSKELSPSSSSDEILTSSGTGITTSEHLQGVNNSLSSQDFSALCENKGETLDKEEHPLSEKQKGPCLRTLRDRNTNVPESGRDSDSCVWVSFGMNGPVPLPASDVPSLGLITKVKESNIIKSNNSREEMVHQHDVATSSVKGKIDTNIPKLNDDIQAVRSKPDDNRSSLKILESRAAATDDIPSYTADHLVKETTELVLNEYYEKKERSLKQGAILSSKETKHWKPVRPQDKLKVTTTQIENDPEKGSTLNPSIRLRNAPRRGLKSTDDLSKEIHQSKKDKVSKRTGNPMEAQKGGEKKQSQENSSVMSSLLEPSSEVPKSVEAHEDPSQKSKTLHEKCTKILAEDLQRENDQYYRPKKIQKVLNENIQNLTTKDPIDNMSLTHDVTRSKKSCDDQNNQSSANTDSIPEAVQEHHDSTAASETPRAESSASRTESEASEPDVSSEKVNEVSAERDDQLLGSMSIDVPVPAHDPEFEKVWGERARKKRKNRLKRQTSELPSQEKSPPSPVDKLQETLTKVDTTPSTESTSGKGSGLAKEEKEIKKKIRKPRKKDESGSDSDSSSHSEGSTKSTYHDIQQRLEVQHEEERGRRLAQEIKGFNWLEQKIKNSSLNTSSSSSSSSSATTTPSSTPVPKRPPPMLLPKTQNFAFTQSLPSPYVAAAPSASFPFPAKKREESDTRRNSIGGSVSTGLRGHLQTAVPPLVQASKVTALPKRRLSPPNLLSSPTAGNQTGSPVVTAVVAVPTSNPTVTLPVSPIINATVAVPYSNPIAVHGNINIRPTMGVMYEPMHSSGTTTYTLAEANTASLFSSQDCNRATLYSSTDSNTATLYGVTNPQLEVLYENAEATAGILYGDSNISPKLSSGNVPQPVQQSTNTSELSSHPSSVKAISTAKQEGSRDHTWGHTKAVVDNPPSNPQVFSAGTSSKQQPQSSSGPSTGLRFSHKHALLKRAFSDMLKSDSEPSPDPIQEEDNKESDAAKDIIPSLVASSTKSNDDPNSVLKDISDEIKPKLATEKNDKSQTCEIAESQIAKTKEQKDEMLQGLPGKHKFMDCLNDEELLKSEAKLNSNAKDREVGESDSAKMLFTVLYEELQRTRQEVERLRKQQELMLTEKSEKKEDEREEKQSTHIKESSESPESSSNKVQNIDDNFVAQAEKTGKISIRNDLLACESLVSSASKDLVSSTSPCDTRVNAKASVIVTERPLPSPLSKASPLLSQTSPGSCRGSPRSCQMSPLSRTSPMLNLTSRENSLMFANSVSPIQTQADLSILHMSVGPPHTSPTASQNSAIISPYSTPGVATGTPRASPILPRNSPGYSRNSPGVSGSPAVPKISPALLKASPAAQRCSPGAASSDQTLAEIASNKLRSEFRINSEVDVMPVSVASRPSLSEPSPQTYLQLVREVPKDQESPRLFDAVRGRRQEDISERERIPFGQFPHETIKRYLQTQSAETETKRARLSTSDLPEFPPTSHKPPPPLKPVAGLQRRYSDNIDTRKVEPVMVPFPHTSIPGYSNSTTGHNNSATLYTYAQPQSSPTHHHSAAQHVRRGSDSNMDRNRDYQQALALQHTQYQQHLGSGPPIMRSLGPDKATIFPVPAPSSSTGIHPYMKPRTPPTARSSVIDQHQASLLEQSGMAYFQKAKQTLQQNFDSLTSERAVGVGQERLQPSIGPFEKARQPQTFAPRVLVQQSIPEAGPRMRPPPSFPNPHYTNCNPHIPNVMPSHHYLNNMHHNSGPNLHQMGSSGLHLGGLQPSSTSLPNSNSNLRSISGGSSDKKRCLRCPQQARFLCSGCKKAWYCSENCQRDHWAIHNTSCVP